MYKRLTQLRRLFFIMGRFCFGGVWFGRKLGVQIGNHCRIYSTRFGSEPFLINIGNNVTVTSGVSFITHDGSTGLARDEKGRRYTYGRIIIGDNVFIGVNSILLPGVEIGSDVIIGAGSVVNRSIPSGTVAAGTPVRQIGSFKEYVEIALASLKSDADLASCKTYKERVMTALREESAPTIRCEEMPNKK